MVTRRLLHPQVSLAMNVIFNPFVDRVDDHLYSGAQIVVSNCMVIRFRKETLDVLWFKDLFERGMIST